MALRLALGKLELALQRRCPARSAEWTSVLNAITVQLELQRPSYEVVAALAAALAAFIGDAGLPSDGDVADALNQVVSLCRAGQALGPPAEEPDEPMMLGPNATQIVSCLRYQLGLPVDAIYLFLTQQFKTEISLPTLHRIILALPPPTPPPAAPPRPSRRRR